MGIDPAVRTLGVFCLCDDVYCSFTEDLIKLQDAKRHRSEKVNELQHSAVECGRMIGQAFQVDSQIEDMLGWFALCIQVDEVSVAIEDVTRIGSSTGPYGGSSCVPSSSYWAAALASQCASRSFNVFRANVCKVKANFGLEKSGQHSINKAEALSLVRDRLGLAVHTNHEADAFLCLATVFFPRLPSHRRLSRKSLRDPVIVRNDIDSYINGFWLPFEQPTLPDAVLATTTTTTTSSVVQPRTLRDELEL